MSIQLSLDAAPCKMQNVQQNLLIGKPGPELYPAPRPASVAGPRVTGLHPTRAGFPGVRPHTRQIPDRNATLSLSLSLLFALSFHWHPQISRCHCNHAAYTSAQRLSHRQHAAPLPPLRSGHPSFSRSLDLGRLLLVLATRALLLLLLLLANI